MEHTLDKSGNPLVKHDAIDIEISEDNFVSIICDECNQEIYAENLETFLDALGIKNHFIIERNG